jgi:hypothetical protein
MIYVCNAQMVILQLLMVQRVLTPLVTAPFMMTMAGVWLVKEILLSQLTLYHV